MTAVELPPEVLSHLAVYRQATGHTLDRAVIRILSIGLATWQAEPHYMPERVCGHVRDLLHTEAEVH